MLTLQHGDRLVFATHNRGKLAELQALLGAHGIEAVSAADMNLPEPEETGASYYDNAALKALAAAKATGLAALADDSGLSVDALNGAPGIYSARWAGEQRDFRLAMQRVEEELNKRGATNASASFITSLVLALPNGNIQEFKGEVRGTLTFPPRGANGFGYDAIFVPEHDSRTFAEMTAEEKKALSHRARAFVQFAEVCLPR